jgi:hypothetical protein
MNFLRAFALTKAHSLAVSRSDDTIRDLGELFLLKILGGGEASTILLQIACGSES